MPILCSDLIRPTVTPAVQSWPLSGIDRYLLQLVIQGTWVFDAPLDADALKQGLTAVLEAYPILGGRVVAGRYVHWRDGGVPLVEAEESAVRVADFGPEAVDTRRFAERVSTGRIRRGSAPLLAVRLTRIDGGSVLAISASHACVDGNGFYSLARNLSRAATGRPFPPPVFEPLSAAPIPRRRADIARDARQRGWPKMTALDLLRFAGSWPRQGDRSFVAHFPAAALARLKLELARASGCERLSTHSALVAHVTHCLASGLGLRADSSFAISAVVDLRERVPAFTRDFAGNAASVVATAPIAANAEAADIAARIHERLEPLLIPPAPGLDATRRLTEEVAGQRLPYTTVRLAAMLGKRPTLFYTNSFTRFPVYDLDFGEAEPVRPVRVVPHNLGDPIVLWPAPPDVGGIELYFCGALARAVRRLGKDDPWWSELRRYHDAGSR